MNHIIWKDSNPTSTIFDDIYFSAGGGLEESHYVFIDGNNLQQRWQNLNSDFTIIETGLGTGLNFFVAYQLWLSLNILGTLNYISIEKYPLLKEDIKRAISIYPQFSNSLDKFLEQYPSSFIINPIYKHTQEMLSSREFSKKILGRSHEITLEFDKSNSGNDGTIIKGKYYIQLENCNISIFFEDITTALPKITSPADAWFLDGFSPAKNPDMWCEQLYQAMSELTKQSGTFATCTSAGHVRRGLQEHNFQVEKKKGFGRKRVMLVGYK